MKCMHKIITFLFGCSAVVDTPCVRHNVVTAEIPPTAPRLRAETETVSVCQKYADRVYTITKYETWQ